MNTDYNTNMLKSYTRKGRKLLRLVPNIRPDVMIPFLFKERERLEDYLPKSHKWLRKRFDAVKIGGVDVHRNLRYNFPFHYYLPHLANHKYKFIIENRDLRCSHIDLMLLKDRVSFYEFKGYRVFLVEAFNNEHFDQIIEDLAKFLKDG